MPNHEPIKNVFCSNLEKLLLLCRYDEQAAHLASVTTQFGSTQQALQELQAEFADQSHERTNLQAQLTSLQGLHAELQTLHNAQAAQVQSLSEQLSTTKSSSKELQVKLNWISGCNAHPTTVMLL